MPPERTGHDPDHECGPDCPRVAAAGEEFIEHLRRLLAQQAVATDHDPDDCGAQHEPALRWEAVVRPSPGDIMRDEHEVLEVAKVTLQQILRHPKAPTNRGVVAVQVQVQVIYEGYDPAAPTHPTSELFGPFHVPPPGRR